MAPTRQLAKPELPPAILTDAWVKRTWRWMSDAVGVVTSDREQWQGERKCIRGKAATRAIR